MIKQVSINTKKKQMELKVVDNKVQLNKKSAEESILYGEKASNDIGNEDHPDDSLIIAEIQYKKWKYVC